MAGGVDEVDRDRDRLQELLEEVGVLAGRLLGPTQLGDVGDDLHTTTDLPGGIDLRPAGDPQPPAVLLDDVGLGLTCLEGALL